MRNYEAQTKLHLAQSVLLSVCHAMTKAAKLGTDGIELFDGLLVTVVSAVGKRNEFAQIVQKDEEQIVSRTSLVDMKEFMAKMKEGADQAEAKPLADANEVW